jgi:hypothetical protein
MHFYRGTFAAVALACGLPAYAQLSNQIQLKIDSSNRTLSVSAEERVTAEPEIAILHIGFITPPSDAKSAYAAGQGLRIRSFPLSNRPASTRSPSEARARRWWLWTAGRTGSSSSSRGW